MIRTRRHLRKMLILVLSVLLAVSAAADDSDSTSASSPSSIPAPVFENPPTNETSSGSIKLSWEGYASASDTDARTYELQESTTSEFADVTVLYVGPDRASYISGLPDGRYFYRVREMAATGEAGEWSESVSVDVEHHPLSLAFLLFGIGGVVVILTVAVVLRGERGDDNELPSTSS